MWRFLAVAVVVLIAGCGPREIRSFTVTDQSGTIHEYQYQAGSLMKGGHVTWEDQSQVSWTAPDGTKHQMRIPDGWEYVGPEGEG